jgi:hypothetical protein
LESESINENSELKVLFDVHESKKCTVTHFLFANLKAEKIFLNLIVKIVVLEDHTREAHIIYSNKTQQNSAKIAVERQLGIRKIAIIENSMRISKEKGNEYKVLCANFLNIVLEKQNRKEAKIYYDKISEIYHLLKG